MAKLENRYVHALLELSLEHGRLEKHVDDAKFIRQTLNDETIQAFLAHPHIANQEKFDLLETAFKDHTDDLMLGFLHLLIRKNREQVLLPILEEFIESGNKQLGKIEAKLVSATPLKDEQLAIVKKVLSQKLNMQVEVLATTDPDVIGGFYILVDGRVFDATVRSEMNQMRERLKRGGYNAS